MTPEKVIDLDAIRNRATDPRVGPWRSSPAWIVHAEQDREDLLVLLDEARSENARLRERITQGEWCAVCGGTGRGRIRVHRECVIHKHVEVDGIESILPRPQKDWVALWNRAEAAEVGMGEAHDLLLDVYTAKGNEDWFDRRDAFLARFSAPSPTDAGD